MEAFTIDKFEKIQYVMRFPRGYENGGSYPILLFLHGAGTRGTDIDKLLGNPFFEITAAHEDLPFITVAPLCHENSWFDLMETLKRFTLYIRDLPFTDPKRFYLMGCSMGGYGAWQLGMSLSFVFAAIVPICGGGMHWNSWRLKDVPIWAFHGAKDTVVLPEESEILVNTINSRGGNARLTLYPESKHDSWSDTYRNKEVFEWMLSNQKKDVPHDICINPFLSK